MIQAYVLIECGVGKAKGVCAGIKKLNVAGVQVMWVDAVTGPFDVIAAVESDDLNKLGQAVSGGIQRLPGIIRATACPIIAPG